MSHPAFPRSIRAIITYAWGVAIALLLTGCVSVQTVIASTEKPQAAVGYVAGVFSASGADTYGLGITNVNGGEEIVLPFAGPLIANTRATMQERVTMIQLPAGKYRISSWVTFGYLTKEQITRKALPAEAEGLEFSVTPGRVRYLGKFAATTSFSGFRTSFRIRPERIKQDDLALLLDISYPNFSPDLLDPQPDSVY